MCDVCDAFEAGSDENAGYSECPECGETWCSCFNCGSNSLGEECPYCSEEDGEEDGEDGEEDGENED